MAFEDNTTCCIQPCYTYRAPIVNLQNLNSVSFNRSSSKVPKFGAWDGGDNFTVYFDQARKTKHNGMKINPNDPEENPDMFPQNEHQGQGQAQPQTKADTQRKQTKLPQFGAWENEEAAGYTVRFEKARDNRHGGPVVDKNGPQMNRDTAPRVAPSVQGQGHGHGQVRTQAQTQARPVTTRPESREGRAKIPTFGDWENEGGGAGYTGVFDKLKKKHGSNPNPPQPNRDVGPTSTPQDSRAKAPEFGAWEGGEAVQYTEYFDSAKKHKNQRPGRTPNEPQMNRDVGDRGRASPATTAKRESSDDVLRSNGTRGSSSVPVHPKGNQLHPRNGGTRGNPSTSIPEFGSWTSDPSQAEGYTTVFERAKEVKRTPVHHNVPPPRPRPQQQQPHYVHKTQPSCCSIL